MLTRPPSLVPVALALAACQGESTLPPDHAVPFFEAAYGLVAAPLATTATGAGPEAPRPTACPEGGRWLVERDVTRPTAEPEAAVATLSRCGLEGYVATGSLSWSRVPADVDRPAQVQVEGRIEVAGKAEGVCFVGFLYALEGAPRLRGDVCGVPVSEVDVLPEAQP